MPDGFAYSNVLLPGQAALWRHVERDVCASEVGAFEKERVRKAALCSLELRRRRTEVIDLFPIKGRLLGRSVENVRGLDLSDWVITHLVAPVGRAFLVQ